MLHCRREKKEYSIFSVFWWKHFNDFPGQDLAICLLREGGHDLLYLAGREDVHQVDELLGAAVGVAGWLGPHRAEVVGGGGRGGRRRDGAGPDGAAQGERGEPGLRLTEGIR